MEKIAENEFYRLTVKGSHKSRIDNIRRQKVGDQEYLTYDETIIGYTVKGQPRYFNRPLVGMTEEEGETVYEIPYSPDNVKKILSKDEFDTKTSLVVQDQDHKRDVRNSNSGLEAFISLPFDELWRKVTTPPGLW